MNKNNYTTPDQAYELIQAGMNKSTADCWRQSPTSDIFVRCSEELRPDFFEGTTFIPCWSLGQLEYIYLKCTDRQTYILKLENGRTLMEQMIIAILGVLKYNSIDFSKL